MEIQTTLLQGLAIPRISGYSSNVIRMLSNDFCYVLRRLPIARDSDDLYALQKVEEELFHLWKSYRRTMDDMVNNSKLVESWRRLTVL